MPYFHHVTVPSGTVLFDQGDFPATAFYLLQTGILRATYKLPVGQYEEVILPGTSCGELPFFSSTERTATVVAERECELWVLEQEAWERWEGEWAEGARKVLRCVLGLTKERVDAVVRFVLVGSR